MKGQSSLKDFLPFFPPMLDILSLVITKILPAVFNKHLRCLLNTASTSKEKSLQNGEEIKTRKDPVILDF